MEARCVRFVSRDLILDQFLVSVVVGCIHLHRNFFTVFRFPCWVDPNTTFSVREFGGALLHVFWAAYHFCSVGVDLCKELFPIAEDCTQLPE